ncbi:MAG TPA: L,D-transpeptidase family protein [Brumimicrobium sp.]|nr:L,D-transpeptidase family protein [Brumimicrobium sp.]
MNQFTKYYGIEDLKTENPPKEIKDSIIAQNFITQQLLKRNFIKDSTIEGEELIEYLRSFQYMNGLNTDGELGKNTINALVETNYSRYLKGIISIDKMRDFPDSLLGGKLIVINIPSYLLHLYINDHVINTSRVVVGTQRNQTPLFTSTMKYIVVSPYWNVPYSIASKEILPHLKRDSSYLKRNRYSLLDRDRNVLSPESIDWKDYKQSNFPYFVRQEPGPTNSLGLVKLIFPNDKSIYIHDTPSKSLFGRDERTFSHGCIRTENPFKLVNDILTSEKHMYLDSIDVLKNRSNETYLILNETFPVTIIYHTAGISDSTQQVLFYKDIYKKEDHLYKLFQQPAEEK